MLTEIFDNFLFLCKYRQRSSSWNVMQPMNYGIVTRPPPGAIFVN